MINTREEINEIETREIIECINRNKNLFFEDMNKIYKSLTTLRKRMRSK
jgi:hypothetical protein